MNHPALPTPNPKNPPLNLQSSATLCGSNGMPSSDNQPLFPSLTVLQERVHNLVLSGNSTYLREVKPERKERALQKIQKSTCSILLFLSLNLFALPQKAQAAYKFVSLSAAKTYWVELLQHPALRTLPEARVLLQIIRSHKLRVVRESGVLAPSWFAHVENGVLLLNQHEFNSKARTFSIFATASKARLRKASSRFRYWSGGWNSWLWTRMFAIKVLPGLLHAVGRLRFRAIVQQKLPWTFPLETQEETLAGLITQIRFLQRIKASPDLNQAWSLVRYGRHDRAYRKLWRVWQTGSFQGLYAWYKRLASRPTSVLSPTYSLAPISDFLRINLSKKRSPFLLNRKHLDSLLWNRQKDLQKNVSQEIAMLRQYISFVRLKVPQKVEKIIVSRLKRMGISRSARRADLFAAYWRRNLSNHYTNNLMLRRCERKQKLNRRALRILSNPKKFLQLQRAHRYALTRWWKQAPPVPQTSQVKSNKPPASTQPRPQLLPSKP